jgi:predicted nucleic acid-binding protein
VIVVDASAITEFLLQTPLGTRVEQRLFRADEELHAPHLLDVEVVQALRCLVRTGDVLSARAEEALDDLATLAIRRHSHFDLLSRVWELRDNLTAYDAIYVVLAEATDAILVTCDARLGGVSGQDAQIDVVR